jgi:hypothetical protein
MCFLFYSQSQLYKVVLEAEDRAIWVTSKGESYTHGQKSPLTVFFTCLEQTEPFNRGSIDLPGRLTSGRYDHLQYRCLEFRWNGEVIILSEYTHVKPVFRSARPRCRIKILIV